MTSFSGCLSKFQSTLSVRRATHVVDLGPVGVDISIHALRKESDTFPHDLTPSKRFQSTLSVRRATYFDGDLMPRAYFNPRSP